MNVSRFVTQLGYSTLGAVLFLITMATTPAAAQAVAPASTSENTSWDQQLRCDTDAHCSRFTVLEKFDGAAVLDQETGLVWEQSPSTELKVWGKAQLRCTQLVTGGRGGWRLPTVQELGTLVDLSVPGFSLPAGHPFANIQPFLYWSATTTAIVPGAAWFVRFDNRTDYANNISQNATLQVWCVRGGRGSEAQ